LQSSAILDRRALVFSPEQLIDSPPETLLPAALLARGVGQIVGLASREVSRVEGKVQFFDTLARHGANKPPPPPTGTIASTGASGTIAKLRLALQQLVDPHNKKTVIYWARPGGGNEIRRPPLAAVPSEHLATFPNADPDVRRGPRMSGIDGIGIGPGYFWRRMVLQLHREITKTARVH